MHAFSFTRPFALVLALICLAIAAPTSDVHADPVSAAVVHAVGNVPDSAVIKDAIATHLPAATSSTDKTGGSTLKPDSSEISSLCTFIIIANSNTYTTTPVITHTLVQFVLAMVNLIP
ncbi:uncharacterized protein LACBIDRAFT_331789 [Laccaria bicolor S238N-H82]|uniref:Predicted protein n=1 Tax=Laccaria bicolor (strain S238N-H82 / ATCC MYA-4686) TaxID=486041 RepID=B0DQK6_LACBS|nr:uncharacterized protein LACBIDRAFT_331789 [Laccaria bicolor S238N-H82]EDR03130.1 predicted protein [Laccaria bicolor S238N-H82]|eukprot:XP_001886271.1 predicted protein [Laccaria bicolor S238N-H82]